MKKTEHEESVAKWHERFSKKQYESQRRENEDAMKHATVIVFCIRSEFCMNRKILPLSDVNNWLVWTHAKRWYLTANAENQVWHLIDALDVSKGCE